MATLKELKEKEVKILSDLGILQVQLHTLNHMYAEVMSQIKSLEDEKKV